MANFGTLMPLLGLAQGAMGGIAQDQDRKREDRERAETERYRRLQEMIMLQSLAGSPGVVMGANAAQTPQAGDLMRIASQAMKVGQNPMAPVQDPTFATDMGQSPRSLIDLGKLTLPGGQQELPVAFDPSQGPVALAQREREKSLLEDMQKEAESYVQWKAAHDVDPDLVGEYIPGVQYDQLYRSLVSSERTRENAALSADRTRAAELAREGRAEQRQSRLRDLKNEAYTYFMANRDATVEDFRKNLRDDLVNVYDAAEVAKIRRELLDVDSGPWDKKAGELRKGYIRYLGPPGKPIDGAEMPGNAALHGAVLDALTQPYGDMDRPLTPAEIISTYEELVAAGKKSQAELDAVRQYLKPIENDDDLAAILARMGLYE